VSSPRASDGVAAVLEARRTGRPLVLATSGTTGTRRSVVRSTDSWWASFEPYSELTGVGPGARVWVPGPLDATMNLFAAVHATVVGATVVADPDAATHACLTPALLDRRGADLRDGSTVVVAGAALPRRLHRTVERLRLVHYYGAAELSFVAAGPHAEDLRPFPGVDVKARNDELWVRSPYLADGYTPDSPAGPLRRTDDGWATVGDRGRLEDGRVVVAGRPDAVTTAGATVVLAEVEAALAPHARGPFAVVGLPHATLGAVLTAVLTDAADAGPLRAHARNALPPSHRPRRWQTRDALPLTAAGKVDRAALVADLGEVREDRREH
jgi:acyl-CoA synthetase (AMP-forming)/AMP-acid ligase II